MSPLLQPAFAVLLLSLIGVAALHTKSRLAGAIAAVPWCIAAIAFAALAFPARGNLVFVGLETPQWLFYAFLGGLVVWNATVIARGFRRRKR
ncbi:MAG TPA: hypothetical protein VGO62_01230 [Myxococcota bacterium]